MADREFDRQHTFEGISLEVTDQRWCLTASTRVMADGLLFGVACLLIGLGFAFFFWLYLTGGTTDLLWVSLFVLALLMVVAPTTAMRLFGKIVVTIEGDQGSVFTGIGFLGRRQHFHWSATTRITEERVVKPKVSYDQLVLSGRRPVQFSQLLSTEQRHSVMQALRQLQRTQPSDDGS